MQRRLRDTPTWVDAKRRVILHPLAEADLVRRGRRGFKLTGSTPPSDEEAAKPLNTYEERAQHNNSIVRT